MSAADAAAFARRVESLRYGTLWISESSGRKALVHAAWLLASTSRLNIGTGIANIYGRDPVAMAARWVAEGARRLHLVDLNGATVGSPINFAVIREIAQAFPQVPIEVEARVCTNWGEK
jgi:hypothetical protein